jgi:FkbM family methyltransferase
MVRRFLGLAPRIEAGPARGMKFACGKGDPACTTGEYERPVQEVLCQLLKEGDVFYDVGANVGFFTLLAARKVGSGGFVYAFEPVPSNAEQIQRNAVLNGCENICVVNVAVSDTVGRGELFLARHAGGSTLAECGAPPDLIGTVEVETISIDSHVKREMVRMPNVVKIDVEGAELSVLQGMREVLRTARPVLLIEFDDEVETTCEQKLARSRQFLTEFGYECDVLDNWYAEQEWCVRHILAIPRKR